MPTPLADVRVLDLSHAVSGPFAGRMLADLGADVVKMESPTGDQTRVLGTFEHGVSTFFAQYNAGKRNVCLDLRHAEGIRVARGLAATVDVIVENFRPGVLDRLGLGYDTLAADNAGLVMLSISGFGTGRPDSGRAVYAPVIHAESGLVARQAAFSGGRPSDIVVSVADYNAGLHGLVGVLAALHMRGVTGRGQHVEISMLDAMAATDDHAHAVLAGQPVPFLGGEIWEAPGGPIMLGSVFRNTWSRLRKTAGLDDPAPGERPLAEKIELRRRAVEQWIASAGTRDELTTRLDEAGIAWAEIRSAEAALDIERLRKRDMVAEVADTHGGTQRVIQSPYRFSAADCGVTAPASSRGEHNRVVLRDWLCMQDEEITELEAAAVLLASTGTSAGR